MGKAEPLTGAPGRCGGGEGVGKGESLGLLWAVGSPGELLPTRAFWAPPPHTHTQPLPPPGAPPGCQADAPMPPSGLWTMTSLMPLSPYLSPTVLLLVSCDLGFVRAGE